jgi:hypothetical protein
MLAPAEGGIALRFDFHPPDKRRRDLDNMLASIKAGCRRHRRRARGERPALRILAQPRTAPSRVAASSSASCREWAPSHGQANVSPGSASRKLVLFALADRHNDEVNGAYPSSSMDCRVHRIEPQDGHQLPESELEELSASSLTAARGAEIRGKSSSIVYNVESSP